MAETIKTLKPSGGDYTSISAWVSGEAKALGVDAVDVLECYKGDYTALGGGTNYIVDDSIISGWSNITSTAYAAIRTPASERHNGKAYDAIGDYTGFTVKKSSIAERSACIKDNQQRTHTLGLIIALDKTVGYGNLRALDIGINGGYGVHGKHIAVSESLATSSGNYISGIAFNVDAQYYTDRTVSLYDSLVIGKGNGASGKWRIGVACAGSHVYNCTVLHADACYEAGKPSNEYASVYNCIAESNAGGTCYSGAGMAGDYNLASDATAPGSNSVQSTTLTYADAANGDYSLASTDTAAIGAGTDDPGTGLYSDDIVSTAFVSPWDMGAFKFSASGGTATVSPATGRVQLKGGQPTISALLEATANPITGSMLLKGAQPAISSAASAAAQPASRAILLKGGQPIVTAATPATVSPAAGRVQVKGGQPAISTSASATAQPAAGAILLKGGQPAISSRLDATAQPLTGSVLLRGEQPSVFTGTAVQVQPLTGAVKLVGGVPSIRAAYTVHPVTGAMLVVGGQPSISIHGEAIAQPQTGAVTLMGGSPTVEGYTPGVWSKISAGGGGWSKVSTPSTTWAKL